MKRVLVSDSMASEVAEIFGNAPGIKVDVKTGMKTEELKAVIKDYDALIVRSSTKATAEIIEAATKLFAIGRNAQAKKALVVLNTDTAAGSNVLEKLRKLPHVLSIKPIKM